MVRIWSHQCRFSTCRSWVVSFSHQGTTL